MSASPGYLFVTARPWVEVWVDGAKVAKETPLRSFELSAGRHVLRFVNARAQFQMEKPVDVPPGGNLSLYVDVPSKKIEVDDAQNR
ncbi:MAG TPA: hypothetical protein VMV18_01630 [bacterium]|nr:hypothetical protein [bacterium]